MFYNKVMQNNFIKDNDRLIVGVSGGPDSMGLLHFLISVKDKLHLDLFVAHINHHTRGKENDVEEKMIKDYCEDKNIPIYVAHFKAHGEGNFHQSARDFRYHFFWQLTKKVNASKIVLAHHQDDQVETLLFKIMRGNNFSGYLGMEPSSLLKEEIMVIRPFLSLTKTEILDYCHRYHIPYQVDSSNISNKYTRNYIRNQIVPLFKAIQPDFNDKMIQYQEQLAEVNDFLMQKVKLLVKEMIISFETDRIILDLNQLKRTHQALMRLMLYDVINLINSHFVELSYEKVNNIINIVKSDKPNITFDLGKNYYCIKAYHHLIFQVGKPQKEAYKIKVDHCKNYKLPNGMNLQVKNVEEKAKINNKTLFLCYNSTIWPLFIRTRKKGDVIKTKVGTKKVNRVFIDEKIPVNARDAWPLLVDQDDQVLWVLGLQKPDFSQLPKSNKYILLEVIY